MLSNLELYGTEEVPPLDALTIARRLELLSDNLEVILDQSYHIRDNERKDAILKGIKFWEGMLEMN